MTPFSHLYPEDDCKCIEKDCRCGRSIRKKLKGKGRTASKDMGDIKLKVTFCIRQHIPCHSMVEFYYFLPTQEAMNRASDETTKKLGQILLSFWYIFDFHNNMAVIQKGMPSMHIIPGIISFSFRIRFPTDIVILPWPMDIQGGSGLFIDFIYIIYIVYFPFGEIFPYIESKAHEVIRDFKDIILVGKVM